MRFLLEIQYIMTKFRILLLIWFPVLLAADGAKILIVFPFYSVSHLGFFTAIGRSLQAAGHEITVVHSFSQAAASQNFTFIDASRPKMPNETNYLPLDAALGATDFINMFIWVTKESEIDCHQTIQMKEIQEILRSKEKKFDVIIADLVGQLFECFVSFAEILKIPVIGAIGARSWRNSDWNMGKPYNPATVPMEMLFVPQKMNFMQRLDNTWHCILDSLLYTFYVYPKLESIKEKYFPNVSPASRIHPSLVFVNDLQIFVPRPSTPNVVQIGGIHMQPTKPLPMTIRKFMDEAENGVILFTFGSMLKMFPKDSKEFSIFKAVFARLPQRVVWKSEEEIEELPANVLVSSWLPQRDILAHKNLVAFITHCGISGIYEALYEGKPLVMLPVFFDQRSNAAILVDLGVGLFIDIQIITADSVSYALNTIINDLKYRNQAQSISKIFKDTPMTSKKSVVYWTEYVIRHNGSAHLRTADAGAPLYRYFLLDVALFIFAILFGFSFLVNWFIKQIRNKKIASKNRYLGR